MIGAAFKTIAATWSHAGGDLVVSRSIQIIRYIDHCLPFKLDGFPFSIAFAYDIFGDNMTISYNFCGLLVLQHF